MIAQFSHDIRTHVGELSERLIGIRRHLHANPELGFAEFKTSALIQNELKAAAIEFRTGFGATGVAALIGAGNGKRVAIRCDIDALPIEDTKQVSYRSQTKGVMHACGHDAHTAIGLGAAFVLARLADRLPGRALVFFQPAEEGLGGARAMIGDGLLEWVMPDIVMGFHNWPPLPGGVVGYHPREAFAATDPFDIIITGRSGHGAHPHLAVDPIAASAQLISSLQHIVAREIAPLSAGVVTIGKISGGTARNQIPDAVTLEGTVRSQKPEVRAAILAAMERICAGIAATHRVECQLKFGQGVPPVLNDPEILHPALAVLREHLGAQQVVELPIGSMGSEDYAEFSTRIPSAHFRIGSGIEGYQTMLHAANFDIDERAIPTGVETMVLAALNAMEAA